MTADVTKKKPLRRITRATYHYVDGAPVEGPPLDVWGNLSGVWGDLTGVSGDLTGIWGDLTNVWGDADLIPMFARPCSVEDWIEK